MLLYYSLTHLVLAWALVSWNSVQGGLEECGKGLDLEKENVDPATRVKHPRLPRAKKVCTIVDVFSISSGADR